jgi:hypothetical protein
MLEIAINEQTRKPWQMMPLSEAALTPKCKDLLSAIATELRDKYELSDDAQGGAFGALEGETFRCELA